MSYIIAIDVGIKNLGICVFDFCSSKVVYWQCVSLVPNGRYIPANNVDYVRSFVNRHSNYFEQANKVIIERQIRCNMRIVVAILQTMFWEICIVISARSVKMHYDLSTKNYRMNKEKAVKWVTQFIQANNNAFETSAIDAFKTKSKQDDLADSLLLILYYLDTYSNHLNEEHIFNGFLQSGLLL